MSVKGLFEGCSHEEIEEVFDTWMKRDFEDIPVATFFAALEEIGARCQNAGEVSPAAFCGNEDCPR